jgi:hypothetical protein
MHTARITRLTTVLVIVFTIAVSVNGLLAASSSSQEHTIGNLAGSWRLNKELSDDPNAVMERMKEEHRAGGRMPGGGGFGGGMGGHGGGGMSAGGGSAMDPERMQEMRAMMMRALDAPAKLIITQGDGTITFTGPDGVSVALATNNKKQKVRVDNREVEMKAKWDDTRLVKETSLGNGLKTIETYSLSPGETPRLQVDVKVEGPRSIALKRVYDSDAR